MTVCVAAVQQVSGGAYVLQLAPAQTDISQCAYTIEDGSSTAWRELGNMSMANAQQVGVAVIVVWAIAWGFKQIARTIKTTDTNSEI